MSSPCTGSQRFFRCRVKDFASCFYACRIPIEEDQPDTLRSKSPEMSSGSIVFDFDGAGKSCRKMSTASKMRGESAVQTYSSASSSFPEPSFAEEEYIVFRFREDGEIDLINDDRSSEDHDEHKHKDTQNSGGKKGRTETDTERHRPNDENKVVDPVSVEEPNASKTDSWESTDSSLSDTTSTSSFAFPVLGIEWMGSPVHMPKSVKQSVRLHCCRF